MPDHVIDEPDFYIRAPAPIGKVLADAKAAEAKAEEAAPAKAEEAAPAFLQLSRRTQKLSQKRAQESSESSESSGSSSSGSSSSDSD
jgi:hypothetical protein